MGDVIYIEASSGAVKRVGRCDAYATEFDLEAEEYVPLPKGDVHKRKEVVQVRACKGGAARQGAHCSDASREHMSKPGTMRCVLAGLVLICAAQAHALLAISWGACCSVNPRQRCAPELPTSAPPWCRMLPCMTWMPPMHGRGVGMTS